MGFLERIAPKWALSRERARAELHALRKIAGAAVDRLNSDWVTPSTSIDAELLDDLPRLRDRSRALVRDDPHAAAAVNTRTSHVVGEIVRMQAKCVPDPDDLPPWLVGIKVRKNNADTANTHAEMAWSTIEDDFDGYGTSFSEMLELTERQLVESGESLTRIVNVRRRDTPLTFAAQVIEPDRLATPTDRINSGDFRDGVEFDDRGRPVAYWISKNHPGDVLTNHSREFERIPASLIIHEFNTLRPGQSRGMPWLTPVMMYLRHKGKYVEAELIAQRLSACLSLFITSGNPNTVVAQKSVGQSDGTRQTQIRAGEISYLGENQQVHQLDPIRPGDSFAPNLHEILRGIGTALDIPYVVLAKDFENVNYSSMRAAIISMERYVCIARERKRTRLIRRLWSTFYDEAVMAGMIVAPNYSRRRIAYQRLRVQWPTSRWVDPQKEVAADTKAVTSRVIPLAVIASKYGMDEEEMIRMVAEEEDLRKELGVALEGDIGSAPPDENEEVAPPRIIQRNNGHAMR